MDLPIQTEVLHLLFKLFSQDTLSNQDQMSVRIGSRALSERFQEHCVVFLRGKSCDADKKNISVSEACSCPPFVAWSLRPSIVVRWNAVRNYAAPPNSIKAP